MISTVNNNKIVKKTFRDHSASNIEDLCNKLGNACDEYFVECDRNDVNLKCDWWLYKLNSLYFQSCPLKCKTISVKNLQKTWIYVELKRMANYKHKLFKQYKSGNINFGVYNSYKINLCHKIKNTKKTYCCKMFENCKNDSKKTWKTITSILSNKRKIESHIVLTGDNDEDICDSLEIANKFCNFFSTIVDKLDETIPTTDD